MDSFMRRAATAALLLYSSCAAGQDTTVSPTTTSPSTTEKTCATILAPSYTPPVVADGWSAQLVATGLKSPRGIKFDSKGGLLVVEAGSGLRHLTLQDSGGTCVSVKNSTSVFTDEKINHGLELSEDGTTLYISSSENVDRHSYDPDTKTVSNLQRLVANMSHSGPGHVTRTLLLSRHQPDLLLVSRGSMTNIDLMAANQSTGISQIRAFNISNTTSETLMQRPYSYPDDGVLIGWGLRNSVGVAEHPLTGGIWSVENSADNLSRLGRDIHEDNPGEELNFHGYLNDSSSLGRNHGYPSCFALWNTTDFPGLGNLTVGSQFSVSNNATLNDTTCAQHYTPPRLTFQAHTAPLDIKFLPSDASLAFISFHGSWNRDHPAGYKLSYVAFNTSTGEPAEPSDSVVAVKDVMTAADVGACSKGVCLRPAGLAFDKKGERLFVSSDATGEIWVVMKNGGWGEGNGGEGDAKTTSAGSEGPTGTETGRPVASTSSGAAVKRIGGGARGEGCVAVVVTVGMVALGGLAFVG
ncbi:hypothetical protein VTI74DRAFT_3682 [Chaetomium olivicolor]